MYRIVIILFSITLGLELCAQKLGMPEIEHFNRRQYGGATQNWQLSQSDDDLMYVANNRGLLEYDGVNWKRHVVTGTGALRSVKCINDRIYTGTHSDFGYFEYDSLQHIRYVSLATSDSLRSLGDVWNIYKWNEKLIIHTEKALVIIKDDHVIRLIPNMSRFVSCFLVNEMFLVYDEQNGLMELRGNKIYPLLGGEFFVEKNITSIMSLSNTELLIGTMNNGAFIWNMKNVIPWEGAVNKILKEVNVFCGIRYNDDLLLFGTIQNGLMVTDNEGELLMHISKDKGLMNNTVLGLFVDKEGSVWCGLDNGIARISLASNISFLTGYYNLGTGYVQEYYSNEWYFGTNQGLYKIKDKVFSDPLKDRNDFLKIKGTEGQVWSLFKDNDNLLCGHNMGVIEVAGDKSRVITPPSVNGVWNFKSIGNDSTRLICGTYNGLIMLSKHRGKWKYDVNIQGFNKPSRFIEWDSHGRLWVADGYDTLYCLSLSNDYSAVDSIQTYSLDSFNGSVSVKVTRINDQMLIVGSNGLYEIDTNGQLVVCELLDRFFVDDVYPSVIEEDEFKNLWLFYPEHVEMLKYIKDDTYNKVVLPFLTLENKLVSNFESVFVADESSVFFGVEDGFAHYRPQKLTNFRRPFKVHVRGFRGKNDSLAYILPQAESTEKIYRYSQLVYPYRNNIFEVEYAAAFYSDKNIEYSTFLSSLDDAPGEWNRATKRQFSKLREGDYYFTVKARNCYGVESIPHTFSFRILPPWYRSLYARIAYALLFLIVAFVLIYIFNKRVEINRQKEKHKARKHYQKKEEQLTTEALRAEKKVIKMRNEKLRSEMQFKEKELAGLTVHIVQKNDLLSELQGQLKRIKRIKGQEESERKIDRLIQKIGKDIDNESNWQLFENQFEQVHHSFISRLSDRHGDLTEKEKKLCAYIKLGMASKEIASLMNISTRSVENNRYKLRQKLSLHKGDDLSDYISSIS